MVLRNLILLVLTATLAKKMHDKRHPQAQQQQPSREPFPFPTSKNPPVRRA